jgi:hypothetical protein
VPSSPAGAAAAAATPPAPTGAAALLAAGRQYFKVLCGNLHGWFDLRDCHVLVAGGQVRISSLITVPGTTILQSLQTLALVLGVECSHVLATSSPAAIV